jgi:predicted extracellular nuclease
MLFAGCDFFQKKAKVPDDRTLTFVFYNVENLFDFSDDPAIDDQEFLPGGTRQWNEKRYRKKIDDISRVIKELGRKELPEIIGFCEVENAGVVKDLVTHINLSAGNYKVIHFNGRDPRGIEQALAYRPSEFSVMSQKLIPVKTRFGGSIGRGILLVTGKSNNGEIFHIFVNHWISRDSNDPASESARIDMAGELRKQIDAIRASDKSCHIVIMGDMNDEPNDKSLFHVLEAVPPGRHSPSGLVNLMFPACQRGDGTVKFQGDWKMLDQIIVSESLIDRYGYHVEGNRGQVFSAYWMEFHQRNGDVSPNRTYLGNEYTGGPSDHFPLYCRLIR